MINLIKYFENNTNDQVYVTTQYFHWYYSIISFVHTHAIRNIKRQFLDNLFLDTPIWLTNDKQIQSIRRNRTDDT